MAVKEETDIERREGGGLGADRSAEEDDEDGLDLSAMADVAGYVLRAPRRRSRLFAGLLLIGAVVGATVYVYYPRTYVTDVKILAQRNLVLPALGNPNRAVPRDADNPTKNVGDTILQHDNLVSLIKEVNLVDRWESTRPPILRLRDSLSEKVSGTPDDADRLRAIEGVLEKRLTVTSDDTTITITAEWTDARMAYDLASTVEKNFVDARYDADVNVINDAIAILEEHAQEEKKDFDTARADLDSAQKAKPAAHTNSVPTAAMSAWAPTLVSPVDGNTLKALEGTRAAIKQIEDTRTARVADINRQINEASVTLAPAHPTIVALKQRLADAQQDPPELLQLRADERSLIDKVNAATPPTPGPTTASAPPSANPLLATYTPPPPTTNEDPMVTVARMKLQTSAQKYAEIESRIDSAKIEIDIARAAHKYRYSIVRPAEVSAKPRRPNPILLAAGVVLGALAFAFAGVLFGERRRGKLLEPWQVKRKLKLTVLGTLEG